MNVNMNMNESFTLPGARCLVRVLVQGSVHVPVQVPGSAQTPARDEAEAAAFHRWGPNLELRTSNLELRTSNLEPNSNVNTNRAPRTEKRELEHHHA